MTRLERLARELERTGGLYDFNDIAAALHNGDMQSFTDGVNLIVTRVADFPRKRVLEIVLAMGDIETLKRLQEGLFDFARANDCSLVLASGRLGWETQMTEGWSRVSSNYIKEI